MDNNIKSWRLKRLMTQTELADVLGISKPLLSMVENGKATFSIKIKRLVKEYYGEEILKIMEGDYDSN